MAPAAASAVVTLGESQFLGHYPQRTVVIAHVTGWTTLSDGVNTWTYGLGGHPDLGGGAVGIVYANRVPLFLDNGSDDNPFEVTDTVEVRGDLSLIQIPQGIVVGDDGRPWTMTGQGTASLTRVSATLGLGDGWNPNSPYSMTEVKVVEGQYVLLMPRAVEGPSLPAAADPTTWRFTADSGGPPREICGIALREDCQMVVPEAGTVTVTGYANSGPPMTASIHFTVPSSRLELHLSRDSIASGDTVFVTTKIIGAQSSEIYGYEYDAPEWATGTCVTAYGAGLSTCYIVLTGPGTITVWANVDGRDLSASGTIKVTEARPKDDPPLTITILKAEGPNPNKSFTLDPGERKISLSAQLTPATANAVVAWEVVDAPGDRVSAIPPTEPLVGLETNFLLPQHSRTRWPAGVENHPGELDQKTLRYQVTAVATANGRVVRSSPVIVSQDLVDTIREEYYEFELKTRTPGRSAFSASAPVKQGEAGANNGDYSLAVINPAFATKLDALKVSWKGQWQVNTIYRNPVHNLARHIPNQASKPSPISWHMWGCAADLQTFPTGSTATETADRLRFWNALSALARAQGWDVEPLKASTVSHVHVELDCP